MRQIVWNLATNGLRAMPSGGRLRLSRRRRATDPRRGERRSGDRGAGRRGRDRAGGDRRHLPAVPRRLRRGTGLGLSIVHRIASDYGGEVRVKSNSGEGTTVEVGTADGRGPEAAAAGCTSKELTWPTENTRSRPSPRTAARILVVDDERSMREMLAHPAAPGRARRRRWPTTAAARSRCLNQQAVRPGRLRRADAGHRRARGAAPRAQHQPVGHRHHDHRLRVAGSDQGRRAARRHRLRREAVQHRGPEVPHPQGARSPPAAAGERPAQAGDALGPPVRQHHREQQRDAAGVRDGGDDRADRQHGARHRRVGHRQGADRARHPRPIVAERSPVRRRQLRRALRDAARFGALRPHAGIVHRRRRRTRRA